MKYSVGESQLEIGKDLSLCVCGVWPLIQKSPESFYFVLMHHCVRFTTAQNFKQVAQWRTSNSNQNLNLISRKHWDGQVHSLPIIAPLSALSQTDKSEHEGSFYGKDQKGG